MDKLLELAAKLPSGLNDPKALGKFHHERQELADALAAGDRIGALLEAADCLYYVMKARHNGLANDDDTVRMMEDIIVASGFLPTKIRAAALIKYGLRARPGNPKDDAAERAAVENLIIKD